MCKKCNVKSTYRRSPRQHGRPPRVFVICTNCGAEVQATIKAGEVHEFPSRRKVPDEYRLTEYETLRLTKAEKKRFKASGRTARDVFLAGLMAGTDR